MVREFELLSEIYRFNQRLDRQPEVSATGLQDTAADRDRSKNRFRRVLIPPGDDMGMVEVWPAEILPGKAENPALGVLVAVDQIVGGSHVNVERDPIELIGRKAITRNISDIAAMGARPVASVAACVLPTNFGRDRANALFHAMRAVAAHFGCPLIGGDISIDRHAPLVISVTVLAEPGPKGVKQRGDAQPGDEVYVSGRLGGSWRQPHTQTAREQHAPGLGAAEPGRRASASANEPGDPSDRVGERAVAPAAEWPGQPWHLTFEPRLALALELVQQVEVNAMIDLSDGLGRDLDHIAEMSGLRASIDAERLPITPGCDWRQAVGDGEDYELCFTVPAGSHVPNELLGVPLTRVGVMLQPEASAGATPPSEAETWRTVVIADGEKYDAAQLGWEHAGDE